MRNDMSGCLSTWARNVHDTINSSASRVKNVVVACFGGCADTILAHSTRTDNDVKTYTVLHSDVVVTSASLVCTVGRDSLFEWFLVDEGIIIFVDGKKFKVLRNGLSE